MTNLTLDTKLHRFKTLLDKFEELNLPETELNLFQVGARGHFENPTTELLSFFLDPAKAHKLDDSFFNGLQSILFSKKISSDIGMLESVDTEVSTESGKRIDLLLETDNALILVECKIYHHQNNPFDDYTAYGNNRIKKASKDLNSKNLVKLVLCLDGNISPSLVAEGWHGISYNELVQSIESELSTVILANPYNKWALFAREFLLHLKEFNMMSNIDKNEIEFLNKNLHEFSKLSAYIHEDLMSRIGNDITIDLNNADLENFECKTKSAKWYYYEPVIKFSNKHWTTDSDIVLWMKASDKSITHKINLHISSQSDELTKKFVELIGDWSSKRDGNIWYEVDKTYWGISWKFEEFDLKTVSDTIIELMQALNELELVIRPTLAK